MTIRLLVAMVAVVGAVLYVVRRMIEIERAIAAAGDLRVPIWDRLLVERRDRRIFSATIDGDAPAARIDLFERNERIWARVVNGEQGFLLTDLEAASAQAQMSMADASDGKRRP